MELAARLRGGHYDPPWSLPVIVNAFLKRQLALWLAQRLRKGARVLDLGCARGDLLEQISVKRPDLELVGVDLAPTMAQIAAKRSKSLLIAQADGTRLPFADGTFDVVIIMHLLSNLDPERSAPALVRDAYRVSRGWVFAELKVPAVLNLQLLIRRFLLSIPGGRGLGRFLFALPPKSYPSIDVYVHHPQILLANYEERGLLRPWPLLPVPTRVHIIHKPESPAGP